VNAQWPGAAESALIDVSLHVDAGQHVAIVGPSGSGKSTLAAVLMGFLPYSGSVILNGREVCETAEVWRCAGLLTQSAHIFDTTVAANVTLGKRDATDSQIDKAIRQARLDSWITTLPNGLETEVGSFGSAMSGGERQRLALARLLISEPSLYVLDEPTEHLDAQNATELDQTILAAVGDSSMIMISHRLTTLSLMDRIIVMEQGRISAVGTHAELMNSGGWYADQIRQEGERTDMVNFVQTLAVGSATPCTT
jgi:ABC-type multidrug transport system fused ATPase/permease subunit